MIHSFTQPFDKQFWSAYKAIEKLLSKEAWAIEKKSLLNSKKFDKVLLELYDISENDFNRGNKQYQMHGILKIDSPAKEVLRYMQIQKILFIKRVRILI